MEPETIILNNVNPEKKLPCFLSYVDASFLTLDMNVSFEMSTEGS